jgi:hypothetical protein
MFPDNSLWLEHTGRTMNAIKNVLSGIAVVIFTLAAIQIILVIGGGW